MKHFPAFCVSCSSLPKEPNVGKLWAATLAQITVEVPKRSWRDTALLFCGRLRVVYSQRTEKVNKEESKLVRSTERTKHWHVVRPKARAENGPWGLHVLFIVYSSEAMKLPFRLFLAERNWYMLPFCSYFFVQCFVFFLRFGFWTFLSNWAMFFLIGKALHICSTFLLTLGQNLFLTCFQLRWCTTYSTL